MEDVEIKVNFHPLFPAGFSLESSGVNSDFLLPGAWPHHLAQPVPTRGWRPDSEGPHLPVLPTSVCGARAHPHPPPPASATTHFSGSHAGFRGTQPTEGSRLLPSDWAQSEKRKAQGGRAQDSLRWRRGRRGAAPTDAATVTAFNSASSCAPYRGPLGQTQRGNPSGLEGADPFYEGYHPN